MARAPMMAPDDPAAAGDTGDTGDTDTDTDTGGDTGGVTWLVSIGRAGDGSYVIHQGAPDDGDVDSAADTDAGAGGDAGAAGEGAGDAVAAGGGEDQDQHVADKGAALKAAMDIMDAAESADGAPGSAEDQFASGFGGDSGAPGAGLKHPPGAAY